MVCTLLAIAAAWAALANYWSHKARNSTTTTGYHRGAMKPRHRCRLLFHFAWGMRSFSCAGDDCPIGGTMDNQRPFPTQRFGQANHFRRETTTTIQRAHFSYKNNPPLTPLTPLKLNIPTTGTANSPSNSYPSDFRYLLLFRLSPPTG